MHPRQAELLKSAAEVAEKFAAKGDKPTTGTPVLWKYVDPDGEEFYLTKKRMTVKSPYSGKAFTSKPERMTGSAVTKELREESKGGGPGGKVTTKKKASDDWKA